MNKQYFYILFSNIFGNAIKYTPEWWKIDIILEKSKLIISDNGEGIKKEDQERIWDRFYQSDNSRWESGFGIWLALAKKIADIYKLKISIQSEQGKGSSFIIEF
jgi:signal transduction histidine kinase